MTLQITQATDYFRYPGEGARGTIPAGTEFTAMNSNGLWIQIYKGGTPYHGKWVLAAYAETVGETPIPDPDPQEPPVEPPIEEPVTPKEVANIHVYDDGTVTVEDFQQG